MENNTLQHHGVKGQRWGVRRYQNKDGSLTATGRRRYNTDAGGKIGIKDAINRKIKAHADAKKKQASMNAKKKAADDAKKKVEDEAKEKENREAKRKEVLESRSAKALYDNAHLFTTQELQAAKTRLDLERSILQLAPKEVSKGEQFVDGVVKWGRKANDLLDTGTKSYNHLARLYNAFSGTDDPLPIVKTGDGDGGNKSKKVKVKTNKDEGGKSEPNNKPKKDNSSDDTKPKNDEPSKSSKNDESSKDTKSQKDNTQSKKETEGKSKHSSDDVERVDAEIISDAEYESIVRSASRKNVNDISYDVSAGRSYISNLLEDNGPFLLEDKGGR